MVEVCNLTKRYGKKLAVDNISFTIKEGEIVGLLGANGAGKSTTMNIISGYIAPTDGTVKINGFDILKNSIKAKSNIGYLPEQPPLYMDMTVKAYLNFMYDLKKVKLDKFNHINEICEKVGLVDVFNRVIKNLSKGYKQRVGIAQALIGYPPLIILDEPTVGLDPRQIISIRNLIKSFSKNHTIIFSSHILSEVQMLCDRVIVINSGKIVSDQKAKDITTNKNCDIVIHVEGESDEVINVLRKINGVLNVDMTKNIDDNTSEYIIKHDGSEDIRKNLFMELAANNFPVIKLDSKESNLEDAFLELTEEFNNDVAKLSEDNNNEEADDSTSQPKETEKIIIEDQNNSINNDNSDV